MSETKMKTVLLRGPVLTQSGYGVHARQIAKWLLTLEKAGKIKLSVQVLPWGDTPWLIGKNTEGGLTEEIMKRSVPPQGKYDVTFQLQLPNEWDPSLGNYNVGITAAVETDRCNPEWVNSCNKMNRIIVPSQHTLKVLKNSGGLIVAPMEVIPESFPEAFQSDETVELALGLDTPFNFLVFGQVTGNNPENDRKNLFYTLKWMCEAFKDKKDVGIVVKTNAGRHTKIDRNIVKNLFEQLLREVRQGSNGPSVYLLHGSMTDREVFSLLRQPSIKAMVSLTRGEGFGLPLLEAAAAGLPIIATNWSAHTEFLNHGRWIQVDYKMSEIHESRVDNKIFMKGSRWAQPLEEDFKRKLRKFHESHSVPTEWAKDLRGKILKDYSHESVSKLYTESFKEVL